MKENKKSIKVRFSTAILIIIIVILSGVIAYLAVKLNQQQTSEKVVGSVEDNTAESFVEATPEPTEEPTAEITEETSAQPIQNTPNNLYHFNPDNGKNTESDVEYSYTKTVEVENVVVDLSLNSNKAVEVRVYESNPEKSINSNDSFVKGMKRKISNDENDKEIIKGFSGKVDEIFVAEMGQDITGTVILFLMEDGTVEYIGLRDLMQTNNLASRGKIKGLKNIIKVENVDAMQNVDETGGPGWVTTIAIDDTGAFYDISNIFNDMQIDTNKIN